MSHLPFSDREVERVLAGQQPYGRPELADVAYFVARLRTLVDFEAPPEMSPELRAQVEAEEARQAQRSTGRRRLRRPRSVPASVPEGAVGVIRLDTRRAPAKASHRWRLVAAAAAVLVIGAVTTVGLTAGGGSEPDVATETARPASEPSTTADDPTTGVDDGPPAASSGDPGSQPTVPSQPPDTHVDTSAVPPTSSDGHSQGVAGPPEWAEDWWPSECSWPDFDCACDQFDSERDRDACLELAREYGEEDGSLPSGGGGRP